MPNTLAEPWTWQSVPEWERAILQSLIAELEKMPGVHCKLRVPSPHWEERYWYGIEVSAQLMIISNVYALGDRISLFTHGAERSFELADPHSVESVVAMVADTIDHYKVRQ